MCKISIIVPVYNTEKYLEKCLNSLVNQTIKDIEIIVVNDGSTDNSENIIKKYLEKYNTMIKYYKKENGGLSSARNYGVKFATGKYIAFVDSDDYIDENLFLKLEGYIEKGIELIKYKAIKIYEDGRKEKISGPIFEEKIGQDAFEFFLERERLFEPAWLYLYKKEFWNRNNFKYKLNTYHEDFGLTPIIICSANSIVSVDIYGYYYIQRANSIVTDKTKCIKKAKDLLLHYDNMINVTQKMNFDNNTLNNIKKYYTNAIILKFNELPKQYYSEYKKEIRKRKLIKNLKPRSFRQLIKYILILVDVRLYLKLR